jgi:predicted transglutaminase-like cysteine proteinase
MRREGRAMSRARLLEEINERVNQFPYATDLSVWHSPDHWERISMQNRGDCDDYVMEKRWQCLAAGVPMADMRIATCITETGGMHAILIVADPEEKGDWILDNRLPHIGTLDEVRRLGYRGVALQRPGEWLWEGWAI